MEGRKNRNKKKERKSLKKERAKKTINPCA